MLDCVLCGSVFVNWICSVQMGCLLQISLEPLDLGTSSDLLVGQRVFALGNPFGLDHSLTTGILEVLRVQFNHGYTITRIWIIL